MPAVVACLFTLTGCGVTSRRDVNATTVDGGTVSVTSREFMRNAAQACFETAAGSGRYDCTMIEHGKRVRCRGLTLRQADALTAESCRLRPPR
jgi:hypothetical protein